MFSLKRLQLKIRILYSHKSIETSNQVNLKKSTNNIKLNFKSVWGFHKTETQMIH